MPKVHSGNNYSKRYSEADLENALEAIKNGMGKKTAARSFNVPRATLQFRLSKDFVKSRPGPDTVLSSQEERQLAKWIIESSRKGFPRRKEDVIKSVKLFLDQVPRPNSFIENTPGEGWYKLFLKRHQELSIRTSEAVTSASSKVSESQIRNWFRQIEDYLKENELFYILSDPSRVYNGDETNFVLCPKNTRVIAPKGEKNVYEVDHAQSKSCITVMFTFAADGETTPPMIIFPLKRMRPDIQKSVPREWGIGLSENGWMKAELFNQYIQNVFHPALQKKNVTFPVILFVDGHKSHTTLQLAQLCQSLGIILIALYPNATRLLQPADVAAFRPIKVMWRKAVLEWRTNNLTKTLLKTDVGPILEKLLPKIKKQVLKKGFEACGLCPFNPDQVDYTKCLMPSKPQQAILDDNVSVNMNYQTFQEIVGPQLIRKMKNQILGKSLEAKKLFEIYKHLVPKISMQSSSSKIIQSTPSELIQNLDYIYDVDLQIEGKTEQSNDFTINANDDITKEKLATAEVVSDILGYEINSKDFKVANEVLITMTKPEIPVSNSPRILSPTNDSPVPEPNQTAEIIFENQKAYYDLITPPLCIPSASQQNEINSEDIEIANEVLITITDSEIPVSNSPIIISPINDSSVPEPKQTAEIIFEYQKPNNDSMSPPFCIQSTSRQNVKFIGGKWVLVDVVPNKNLSKTPEKNTFEDFLPLPKTPIKKQKTDTQHRSFVLTSKDWEAAELQKQQKKTEAIQQKEAKRKERLEKAELKRATIAKKLADNKNKKKNIKTDIQNKTNKAKSDNQNKTNKVIILTNVLVKPANATILEKNEEVIEDKQTIDNVQTMKQEEHKRQNLPTKYEDNRRDITEKEKLTNEIDNQQTIEQDKPKKMPPSTKYQEKMKEIHKKNRSKYVFEEERKSGGLTKPLSDKDILRILEEGEV